MQTHNTLTEHDMINDEQTLVSVTNEYGRALPIYDDGCGPLWLHRDSTGISGIVRAQTWETAYEICEDEFFPAGDFDPADFATVFMSGRELWLHEHDGNCEAWRALPEAEKDAAYQAAGKDIPFTGELSEHPCWQEQYGFRSNGRKEADGTISTIYEKDLNGDALDRLTPELAKRLGLTVNVQNAD